MTASGRAALMMVAALLVVAGQRPALAAPSATDEARERFGRGVQLFHEGSLEAALAEFQKAHQLAPNYRLHYNVAQVQYELHNFVEALRSFWKYLAQGGSEIPADRRQQVEAEIRKLEKRVGYVTITTNVSGAQISVDGVPMGISPFTAPVLVNPGSRRVSANKAGYLPAVNTVTAAGGEKLSLTLNLMEGSVGAGALAARPSPFADAQRQCRLGPPGSHVDKPGRHQRAGGLGLGLRLRDPGRRGRVRAGADAHPEHPGDHRRFAEPHETLRGDHRRPDGGRGGRGRLHDLLRADRRGAPAGAGRHETGRRHAPDAVPHARGRPAGRQVVTWGPAVRAGRCGARIELKSLYFQRLSPYPAWQ